MWSKTYTEINNPPMKKGQVMFVSDNLDGGYDEQYIKIATQDGHFNDFEYGLPFGVKTEMVEIVPEQSVTGERNEEMTDDDGKMIVGFAIDDLPECDIPDNSNSKYTIIINGKQYTGTAENGEIFIPYLFYTDRGDWTWWSADFGETITLAIYEEQEVVKPLDPKFAGGATVYTHKANDDYLYHFDEKTITVGKKVSKEELNTAFAKGLIYITTSYEEAFGDDILLTPMAGFISNSEKEYGEICFVDPETNNVVWKETSEYVSSGGGGAPV